MPKLKKVKRCEPDCPHGLDVFNEPFALPNGLWLEIEKCDDCDLYESDDDAAQAVAVAAGSVAFLIDTHTLDMSPIGEKEGEIALDHDWVAKHSGRLRSVVTAEAAAKAGLIDLAALKRGLGR